MRCVISKVGRCASWTSWLGRLVGWSFNPSQMDMLTKVIIVENYHVETGQEEGHFLPICVELKRLRRSAWLSTKEPTTRCKFQIPEAGDWWKDRGLINVSLTLCARLDLLISLPPRTKLTANARRAPQRDHHERISHWYICHERTCYWQIVRGLPRYSWGSWVLGTADLPPSAIHAQMEGGRITSASQ